MTTKKRTTLTLALALSTLVVAITPLSALADRDDWHGRGDGDHHREWRYEAPRWHGDDDDHWREGHWYHGYHEGRLGWWWVVAPGLWHFYARAAYADPPPSRVVIVQPPAQTAPPPAAPQYWYYCKPAKAYYPYVSSCPRPWTRVPATPGSRP